MEPGSIPDQGRVNVGWQGLRELVQELIDDRRVEHGVNIASAWPV